MMEKAVMISIHPEWCEKIVNGSKTIEVRKTRPKLEAPFKCYIYCTKAPKGWFRFSSPPVQLDGHVIGEFVCDRIYQYASDLFRSAPVEGADISTEEMVKQSCLSAMQLYKYEHSAEPKENCICLVGLYGWHISDLKIYDRTKLLSEFSSYNCSVKWENGYPMPTHEIKRPPQSWCYVGEVE